MGRNILEQNKNQKKGLQFSYYIVAIIDLLGMSSALEQIKGPPTNEIEKKEFLKYAKPTFGRLGNFRKSIEKIRDDFKRPIESKRQDAKNNLTPEQQTIYKKYSNVQIETEFFSDTAILKINLMENPEIAPITSAWNLLLQLRALMLSCIAGGWPVRGAVELGVCSEMQPYGLFGQALSRAHHIESKIADYPRVVIGGHFLKYLDDTRNIEFADGIFSPEKRIVISFVERIKKSLIKDSDGQIILDYLDKASYGPEGEKTFEDVMKKASLFIEGEISRFKQSSDLKLFDRYNKLKEYFLRKQCWVKNPSP
jgi:hypothetical protein